MKSFGQLARWVYLQLQEFGARNHPGKQNAESEKAVPVTGLESEMKAAAKGVRGDDLVIELQSCLTVIGFPLGNFGRNQNGVDGDMGPVTRAALKMFQTLVSLTPTGEPDPQTMEQLKAAIRAGRRYRSLLPQSGTVRIPLNPIRQFQDAEFVNAIYHYALRDEALSRIPAAVTTAQAILETFYGKRVAVDLKTGRYSYNLFWLKGTGPAGSVRCRTREENRVTGVWEWTVSRFKAYDCYEDSLRGHAEVLTGNPRYAGAFRAKTPAGFVRAIARAGYATDSRYAQKVIYWIKYWGLK
jgi:flagellum-specific peptidoglycan hydrolase FlgJ